MIKELQQLLMLIAVLHDGRKFRSQTSDNVDGSSARMGRVREEKRQERRSEKRKGQGKECAGAWKSSKTTGHVFSNDLWLQRDERLHAVETWTEKIANRIGRSRQPCTQTQLHNFEGGLADLLHFFAVITSTLEDITQHCFVSGVANFKT